MAVKITVFHRISENGPPSVCMQHQKKASIKTKTLILNATMLKLWEGNYRHLSLANPLSDYTVSSADQTAIASIAADVHKKHMLLNFYYDCHT